MFYKLHPSITTISLRLFIFNETLILYFFYFRTQSFIGKLNRKENNY